jgi:hypothetical protein
LENFEEVGCFGKAGAGSSGGEEVGVVNGELPGRSAAHGEAACDDAVFVDVVVGFDVVEGFEEIDLAGEFVGVAVAAVEVENEGVGGGEFAGAAFALGEEVEFGKLFVAAVEPGVEAMRSRGGVCEGGGNDQAVGLDGAVDFGDVAADDEAGLFGPGSFAGFEGSGAVAGAFEKLVGGFDFVG